MGKLDGRVAILSGGAGGIAFEEARLFLQEGAKVILGDIRDELGRKAEAELAETGGDVSYHRLDVTSEDDWRAIVGLAESGYGKLDILVNNAGITIPKPLEETTVDDWDRTMDINVKGVFLGTKYSVEAMKRVGGGAIVNIASTAGLGGTSHFLGSYGPSKAAVQNYTKITALKYATDKIRCNTIFPGPIDTPILWASIGDTPETRKWAVESVPLGRVGLPQDIAKGVLFLVSDDAEWVTGSDLVIDGGMRAN